MASSGDKSFNAACFRGRSKAQMSVGKILDTISAAETPPDSFPVRRRQDEEGLEGESSVGRNVERRGLWNIDLNVAPPEEAESELTVEEGFGNGPPPPPADDVPDASGDMVSVSEDREPSFNGIDEGDIETTKATVMIVDSEAVMEEKKKRNRRWIGLLEVAENAWSERNEEEARTRKRRASHEAELGAEPPTGVTTRSKSSGQRRQSLVAEWNGDVVAAAAEAVVVRSTRGRAVAMPNKYRDSVLGAVAELPRHSRNSKSATVLSAKRNSR